MSSSPSRAPRRPPGAFASEVRRWVRAIPAGCVASYGDVAALAGSPRAARGVGAVLNALPPDSGVPWWRVVNRSGRLSIPAELGLRTLQRTLLEREGVDVHRESGVDMQRYGWRGPDDGEMTD